MDTNVLNPYHFFITQSQSNRWLRSEVAESLKAVKLTMMEWLLLMAIKESKQELTVTAAAELLGVSLPQITALTQNLLELSAIEQKVISSDRRSRELRLTPQGQELGVSSEKAVRQTLLKSTERPNPFLDYCVLLREVVKLPKS